MMVEDGLPTVDKDETSRSLWGFFLAELRRRWWHGAIAVGVVLLAVHGVGVVFAGDYALQSAVYASGIGAAVIGLLSLPVNRKGRVTWRPSPSPLVRRRHFLAVLLFGLLVCAVLGAEAVTAAAPYLETDEGSGFSQPDVFFMVDRIVSRILIGYLAMLVWVFATRHLLWAAGLVCVARCVFVTAVLVLSPPGDEAYGVFRYSHLLIWPFVLLLAVGWTALAYRIVVRRPRERPLRRDYVSPMLVVLGALVFGLGGRAALAWSYAADSGRLGEYERCFPSPGGGRAALMTATKVDVRSMGGAFYSANPPEELWQSWIIADARDGTWRRTPYLSAGSAWHWSPDARYFLYAVERTRTDLFWRQLFRAPLLVVEDVDRPRRRPLCCYDSETGDSRMIDPGGPDLECVGWVQPNVVRFVGTEESDRHLTVAVADVDVAAGTVARRMYGIDGDHPDWDVDVNAWSLSALNLEKLPPRTERVHRAYLLRLETGDLLERSGETAVGRILYGRTQGKDHVWIGARSVRLPPATSAPSQPTDWEMAYSESILLDFATGHTISLKAAPDPVYEDFWTPVTAGPAGRWVRVERPAWSYSHPPRQGMLDLRSGRLYPRPDWPTVVWELPSPSGARWLLLEPDRNAGVYHLWFLDLNKPDLPLTRLETDTPPDVRVREPALPFAVNWINDREIVFLSQQRHLVFYDVVERKRTRIVTVK